MAIIIKGSFKNTLDWLKSIELGTLEAIRQALFFFVVIDMFLFYWYLKWKSFGMAMFIVSIIFLIIILLLEKRKREVIKMEKEQEIKELEEKLKKLKEKPEDKKEDKEEEKKDSGLGIDLGIGSAEEYNKRAEEALGTF